ncbi:unnamed protein product, partial [Scytosiphon promiscuus]
GRTGGDGWPSIWSEATVWICYERLLPPNSVACGVVCSCLDACFPRSIADGCNTGSCWLSWWVLLLWCCLIVHQSSAIERDRHTKTHCREGFEASGYCCGGKMASGDMVMW